MEAAYLFSRVLPPPWAVASRIAVLEPGLAAREAVERLHSRRALVLGYVNAGYAEGRRSYWPLRLRGRVPGRVLVLRVEARPAQRDPAPDSHGLRRRLPGQPRRGHCSRRAAARLAPGAETPERRWPRLVCWAEDAARSHGVPVVYGNIGVAVDMLYMGELLGCLDGVLREELWTLPARRHPRPTETLGAIDALSYPHSRGPYGDSRGPRDGPRGRREAMHAGMEPWLAPRPPARMGPGLLYTSASTVPERRLATS